MPDNARLTHGSIRGHLIQQTAPMLLGIASILSVGIIDAYYIGQLGADELAAVSFIFPVTMALASLGVGVMVGISSVVSRALGANELALAQQRGNLGMALAVMSGLAIAGTLYLVKEPLFELMQAEGKLLPLIDAYMTPFALGFPLLLTNMGGNGVLRSQGAAKRSSAVLIAYAGANWILDPILITGVGSFEGFGVAGAAYATLAGWGVGTVLGFALVQTSQITFNPTSLFRADWRSDVWALIKVGAPAAGTNAINPVGLSIMTALLAGYGQDHVAGFGAAGRLQSFAVVPLLALSSSIGAVVGQNWGAQKRGRARSALFQAGAFCVGYGLLIAAVLVLGRDGFAAIFSEDPGVLDAISAYLLIAAWGFSGYGVLIVVNGALNAIDRASHALMMSLGRVFLVMVPVAWLGGRAFGPNAIYGAELAANLIGGLVAFGLARHIMRRES